MLQYEDEDSRTIFCGNLSDKVTEAVLYELFLQGGPLEKVSQPKDKDGRVRTFAFITYVHAVSVPYAINLFQGTQLFNREIKMNPRNNNNSNVSPKPIENLLLQQPIRNNPFEIITKFANDREHQQSHGSPCDQSSLRSGFNPVPTRASMQMQPQPTKRFNNQPQGNSSNAFDLNKLIAMGQNMLQQSSSRQIDKSTRPNFDMLFVDRNNRNSDRRSNDSRMASRHGGGRSHYREEPYSRRDSPRQHRSSGDRRRR